jgi:predicted component of type VI protein secretion system
MHLQLALVKGSRPQRFIVKRRETVVGRQKGCDLRIPVSEVSRRHCVLRIKAEVVTIEDLDSANGTFVNEERIRGTATVQSGDQIRLGPIVFVAEFLTAEAIPDDEIEEDVEIVDDGMPPVAQPLAEAKKDDTSEPIPVDASDALPPARTGDEPTLTPRKKPKSARLAPRPEEHQVPLPEAAAADKMMQGWQLPAGGDFGALLDGILEGEKDSKKEEPK